jgi:hypothetical protein
MKYLVKFETFNVQDTMAIPTTMKIKYSDKEQAQDTMSIPTSITDKTSEFEKKLQPYYNHVKSLRGIKGLTPICYEELDNMVGFSFIAYYNKVMILTNKKDVSILINEQLIPIVNPLEIVKILESEAI